LVYRVKIRIVFLFKFHPLSNNPEAILFVLGAWIDV